MEIIHKISREEAYKIHKNVCSGWQSEILNIIETQKWNTDIEVKDEIIQRGYKDADVQQKLMIQGIFPNFQEENTVKFENLSEVYAKLGIYHTGMFFGPSGMLPESFSAHYNILKIVEAYNDGRMLDWNNQNQKKYYPVFKKDSSGVWVLFAVCCSYYYAFLGGGLYFYDAADCREAATQFIEEYRKWLPK